MVSNQEEARDRGSAAGSRAGTRTIRLKLDPTRTWSPRAPSPA